jgi:uracil-DNA glycosylase
MMMAMTVSTSNAADTPPEPERDCALCPRLVAYRAANRLAEPGWWNGPAPSFGPADAQLLIVGLAPGRTGANRTGRPFTGDYAGDLLYGALNDLGLSAGAYAGDAHDGLSLRGVMITNAVRCAPPQNKPTPDEINQCRPFLMARLQALPALRAILALGTIAHASVIRAYGLPIGRHPFAHGVETPLGSGITMVSSYHCSRYNTQTKRLTPEMFYAVMKTAIARSTTPND